MQIISLYVSCFTGLVNFYSAETVRIICGLTHLRRLRKNGWILWGYSNNIKDSPTYCASLELKCVPLALLVQKIQRFPYERWGSTTGGPPTVRCALDTRTNFFPYTIIFKLIPTFKLLHQSEVTVGPGTLLYGYLSRKVSFWLFKIFEIQKGRTFNFNDILRLYTLVVNIAIRIRA